MVCYTVYTALHFYFSVLSTDQQLAYLRQRDLSVIYGWILVSCAYTSLTLLHTSILVRYFYYHTMLYLFGTDTPSGVSPPPGDLRRN